MEYEVIIPAAGSGKRMGAGFNKLRMDLHGKTIIEHTIDVFYRDPNCLQIILVICRDDEEFFSALLTKYRDKHVNLIMGGAERQYSVYNGLKAVSKEQIVLVHDGARPFIQREIIARLATTANQSGAAIAGVPVKDTIKKVANDDVVETVDRTSLWQVQTPQAFRFAILEQAHHLAKEEGYLGTDEASLVERAGHVVKVVMGDYDNIKLTTPEDIYFGNAILEKRKDLN